MRFAVMGAGGVGGVVGARLARAGHEVVFVARGAHLQAIRGGGLVVRGPEGTYAAPARAESEEDAARVGPVDAVILAVKAYDNATALVRVRAILDVSEPDAVVLTLQNGVDSPGEVAAMVGETRVLAGAIHVSAAITSPGVVTQVGTQVSIRFGEVFGERSAVTQRAHGLAAALDGAGLGAKAVRDGWVPLWQKLAFLAPLAGLTGAARLPIGPLRDEPAAREAFYAAAAEVAAVARATGVELSEQLSEDVERHLMAQPRAVRSSLLLDLERGRPIEVEAILGAVVRRGRAAGVPTPTMAALHAVLKPFERGRPNLPD